MQRELREETGYESSDWLGLGSFVINGTRQGNRVHGFLALDARQVGGQRLDDGEILAVHEIDWQEFAERVRAGELILDVCQLACLFWMLIRARDSTDPRVKALQF
jgi:8-oxo-dGTP pyrophosphatase MutT (NUDIX family)